MPLCNKSDFSFSANMVSFCRDSNIYNYYSQCELCAFKVIKLDAQIRRIVADLVTFYGNNNNCVIINSLQMLEARFFASNCLC